MLEQKMLSFALMGAGWVLWLLVGLSVLCLTIAVERAFYLILNRTRTAGLQESLAKFLQSGDLDRFRTELDALGGVEARVLAAGAEAAGHSVAAAEDAIAGTLIFERMRLDRGLIVLGTTGSNAPFVGLFGTVLGIIKAFHDLANNQSEVREAVMAGISEALVATAIGLMVAIPAVVLYNYFQRTIKEVLGRAESLSHVLLGRVRKGSTLEGA